jgi:hypothetical protein
MVTWDLKTGEADDPLQGSKREEYRRQRLFSQRLKSQLEAGADLSETPETIWADVLPEYRQDIDNLLGPATARLANLAAWRKQHD